MSHPFFLLWRMRLWGAIRRVLRNTRTIRGAMLVLWALLFFGFILASALLSTPSPDGLVEIKRLGPWVLIGMVAGSLLMSSAEGAVHFSPAEVNLLFPAPFTRRELLLYKVGGMTAGSLLTGVFLGLLFRQHGTWFPAAALGFAVTLLFTQLFHIALALIAGTLGAQAYDRRRKLVLGVVAAAVLAGVLHVGFDALARGWRPFLDEVANSPAMEVVLFPFRSFIEVIVAQNIRDLLPSLGVAAGIAATCLALVLTLDAHYLEVSAVASEKAYTRQQLQRQGLPVTVGIPLSGKARWALPGLPWWGGIGPLLWRQLNTAGRCWTSVIRLALMVAIMGSPFLALVNQEEGNMLLVAAFLTYMTALMGPTFVPFDFRGDIDRLELLKTLPVSASRLAVGQVLGPVIIVTALHWIVLGAVMVIRGAIGVDGVTAFVLVPFVNVFFFALENLLFLWFPSRVLAAPGDLTAMGKVMMYLILKIIVAIVLLLPAAGAAVLLYLLTHNIILAGSSAFAILLAVEALLLYLVGLAFSNFDVSRDMPS